MRRGWSQHVYVISLRLTVWQREKERLDLLHVMVYQLRKPTSFPAHIESPSGQARILDVGYGTGYWMDDIAKCYPDAYLVGIDIAPDDGRSSTDLVDKYNMRFLTRVDFMSPNWKVPHASFDYIRMSQLCGSVPDWEQLCANAIQ